MEWPVSAGECNFIPDLFGWLKEHPVDVLKLSDF